MSKRFVVKEENIYLEENDIIIMGEEVHHINVLRYNVGDTVYINEYEVEITKLLKDRLEGAVIGTMPLIGVPKVEITLIQSYLKSDKMDYVVQKAVELGAKNIIPVITKNTIVKFENKDKVKKQERLNKIAKEAVEQCGRGDLVEVADIVNIKEIYFNSYDKVFVCHEKSSVKLKDEISKIKDIKKIAVIIGPEGGLDDTEVNELLKLENVVDISLGERILRAETASFNILSILNYELE